MKSFAALLFSALFAGFCAAIVLAKIDRAPASASQAGRPNSLQKAVAALQATPAFQKIETLGRQMAGITGLAEKANGPVVRLREPVVVLTGTSNGWKSLEPGEPLVVVGEEGAFLRVSSKGNVVSIPRTAVTLGVASFH